MVSPSLYRSLGFTSQKSLAEVQVLPTSFGARRPTLPIAKTMTLARIATAEGMDKRYERSWLKALQYAFDASPSDKTKEGDGMRMVKRGDVISVPVWIDKPVQADETRDEESDSDSDDEMEGNAKGSTRRPTALVYFVITALSYEPLNPLDEDFRSSISSKARAGELGCWIDIGKEGSTRMVLNGVERCRIAHRSSEKRWNDIGSSIHLPLVLHPILTVPNPDSRDLSFDLSMSPSVSRSTYFRPTPRTSSSVR